MKKHSVNIDHDNDGTNGADHDDHADNNDDYDNAVYDNDDYDNDGDVDEVSGVKPGGAACR